MSITYSPKLMQALYGVSRGKKLFPLNPKTKRPYSNADICRIAGWDSPDEGKGGFHLATLDPEIIIKWWTEWPGALIGAPTGIVNGFWVLDVDRKNGHDGVITLQARGWNPGSGPTARTMSNGIHYIYGCPLEKTLRNEVGFADGLDTRSDGGYVVVYDIEAICAPRPPVPDWLMREVGIDRFGGLVIDGTAERITVPLIPSIERVNETLERWTVEVRDAVEGERNNTLHKAAFILGQMVDAYPEREAEIVAALQGAAVDAGLDAREIDQTVRSGLRNGKAHPVASPFAGVEYQVPEKAFNAERFGSWEDAQTARDAWQAATPKLDRYGPNAPDAVPGVLQTPPPVSNDEWNATSLTPPCIVRNMYYADIGIRVAPGGVGKTTLALYEMVCIALGIHPIFGNMVMRPGRSVLFTSEDRREQLVARLFKICEAMKLSADLIERVKDNVRIAYVDFYKLCYIERDMVYPSAEGIRQVIDAFGPLNPVMLWIDPAVSYGVGESRVNDAEQGLVIAARQIRAGLGDCCVMFIGHTGKGNARMTANEIDQYAGRGGSAMADGSRMVQVMKTLTADEWSELTGDALGPKESGFLIKRAKMSYCAPQPDIYVKRDEWTFKHVVPNGSKDSDDTHNSKYPTTKTQKTYMDNVCDHYKRNNKQWVDKLQMHKEMGEIFMDKYQKRDAFASLKRQKNIIVNPDNKNFIKPTEEIMEIWEENMR